MTKEIALGCMRLNNLSNSEAENLIKCALDNGVRIFDHADIYAGGECEKIFGEVLRRNPQFRRKMIIQSKCGIRNGYYDLSKDYIINQVLNSIKFLNCEYLDILLLHRPDALVDYEEVNDAFNYLYENGLVKSFGVSNMNSMQIELFNRKLNHKIAYNQVQFSIIHSHMISEGLFVNMVDNEAINRSGSMIEYALINDIKLQAWSPLMASWSDGCFVDNLKYEKLNKLLDELANKYQVSKNAIAIAWVLRHPASITPVVGTTSIKHLLEILEAKNIILTKEEWYRLYLSVNHYLP